MLLEAPKFSSIPPLTSTVWVSLAAFTKSHESLHAIPAWTNATLGPAASIPPHPLLSPLLSPGSVGGGWAPPSCPHRDDASRARSAAICCSSKANTALSLVPLQQPQEQCAACMALVRARAHGSAETRALGLGWDQTLPTCPRKCKGCLPVGDIPTPVAQEPGPGVGPALRH